MAAPPNCPLDSNIFKFRVRTAATYYPQPSRAKIGLLRKIERATPLFVAAFLGHSKIVRFLLEKGADVTAKTSNKAQIEFDGLTALNGAVLENGMLTHRLDTLDKQLAVKNAIVLSLLEFGADFSASNTLLWMNQLCYIDTDMTLINHFLDLKQRDPTSGRTVLHHWTILPFKLIEKDTLTIIKLLMEKGADVMTKDNFGFTPVMRAAMSLGPHLYFALLDLFLERDDVAIMEKIEAMEQAGVNILIFHINSPHVLKAFEYWRRATHLRQAEGSYQKKLVLKSVGTVEWTTLDQLENIIQHSSKDEIKLQLFLVQLRIRSSRSWKAVKCLLEAYMGDSAFGYMAFEGKYLELLDIYYAVLNTMLLFQPSEKGIWSASVRVVGSLIYTLWNFNNLNPKVVNLEIIEKSIDLILATDRFRSSDRERDTETENSYSRAMFTFLTMLLGFILFALRVCLILEWTTPR